MRAIQTMGAADFPRLSLALTALAAMGCGATSPEGRPAAANGHPPAPEVAPTASALSQSRTQSQVVELLRPLMVEPSRHNLIRNATFDGSGSLPWMPSFSEPSKGEGGVERGAYCLRISDAGRHQWDAQVRHREMTIEKGHTYSVRFKIASTSPTHVLAKIGMSGPPYQAYWQKALDLTSEPAVVTSEFTMPMQDDPTAELAFHAGGPGATKESPFSVCIDDVVLEDPSFEPRPSVVAAPIPNVLVNQVGYLPLLEKLAIVKSDADTPLSWELLDAKGGIAASGKTIKHPLDAASAERVHFADFSTWVMPGAGYVVRVGRDVSHPFEIGANIYRKLKYDALAYFYQTRSGIAIAMPYAGDPKWTHPAGHLGDRHVPCAPDTSCRYALDVSGGWYDAGDQGKYVVNGGVSVWLLLNEYERAKFFGARVSDFGDGKMNIPEKHNGVPDLLDEARFELEFLMKMQVPRGEPLEGMAHHKIHDKEWTALGTRPDEDLVERFLRPPSTAATLNLAATAAQCARIWKNVDRSFSARCLESAERAWAAAAAHPGVYAPDADSVGGGAYGDGDVSDEIYWAAAELYVTTGKDAYKDSLLRSRHHAAVPGASDDGASTSFSWQQTAALGTISLAVVPNGLPAADLAAARSAIVKAARAYVDIDRAEGYRVGYRAGPSGFPWGSNSNILNNAVLMALAYDFVREPPFVEAVQNAASYVLGRNPLDQSYVTGYGARPLQNPHHRFWAHEANSAFPGPPPGILSGGPNSFLQDPYVRAAGLGGCPPMKCFADNIESYSTNEVAINWNAALAWVAAFLDDYTTKAR